MIDLCLLYPLAYFIEAFRNVLTGGRRFYLLINLPFFQGLLVRLGIIRAYRVYNRARRKCPAYRDFLAENGAKRLRFGRSLDLLPITTKENYVKKFSVEERCYGGQIPKHGSVIDESSGSSGFPNNWVRGPDDRADIKKLLQFSFFLAYPNRDIFLVNCFALGPWATGMNVSMSLVDVAILKSVGPDAAKLENTLRLFGPKYVYLVTGYPPFIKLFLDQTTLDLSQYEIHLVTGGEGMSEGLRTHFEKSFRTVLSSYGASDLDINIGVETEFTVALRKLCFRNPALCIELFGENRVPMIFQYDPLDFHVETTPPKELVYTVCRLNSAAPKVRYNLKDMGGTRRMKDVLRTLVTSGVDPTGLAARRSHLPLLFVYGRGDLAVPFYGAKVLSSDIDAILHGQESLSRKFYSFRLGTFEDQSLNHFLVLTLQLKKGIEPDTLGETERREARDLFFAALRELNQDFREVSKMFTVDRLVLEIHGFQTGPFRGEDIRVKLNYVTPGAR